MSRTKGAHGKHKKEKPIKEKKKRGRPSKQHQQQHQIVNVNVNSDGGGSSRRPQMPAQLPINLFDPSLINPHYGINDRQPINPLIDAATDFMTPVLQAMIANQTQKSQPIIAQIQPQPSQPIKPQPIKPQPTRPKPVINPPIELPPKTPQPTRPKPVINPPIELPQPTPQPLPTKPTQPKPVINPPVELPPKTPKPTFTHKDVEHLIDQIHQKQQENPHIPQNEPKPPEKEVVNDVLGLEINDKYDGLRMANRTMPFSKVVSGTGYGLLGGAALGYAGPNILNTAVTTGAGYIGYQIAGEPGAAIAGIVASGVTDKFNRAVYHPTTTRTNPDEETHNSYSQQHVNGGTVVETRNVTQREPFREPKQKKLLMGRLADAISDINIK